MVGLNLSKLQFRRFDFDALILINTLSLKEADLQIKHPPLFIFAKNRKTFLMLLL
jgi:hypothetical protein